MEAGEYLFFLWAANPKHRHFVFQKFPGSGWDATSTKFGLGTSSLAPFSNRS